MTNISKGRLHYGLDSEFASLGKQKQAPNAKYLPRKSSLERKNICSLSSVSFTAIITIIFWIYIYIHTSNTLSYLSSVSFRFSQNYYRLLLCNSISQQNNQRLYFISSVEAAIITTKTTTSAFLHRKQPNRNRYNNLTLRKFSISNQYVLGKDIQISKKSRHGSMALSTISNSNNNIGGYDPSEGIEISERMKERSNVGNPQRVQVQEKEFSVTSILKELAAIQQQGPQKYCILGTRHCSYLHQQIIELLYV
jgi:hypothetical protein